MPETFINKAAESGIISLDLEEFYPKEEILDFDLKEYLFMGLILKEKDFRNVLQSFNWEIFQNKILLKFGVHPNFHKCEMISNKKNEAFTQSVHVVTIK